MLGYRYENMCSFFSFLLSLGDFVNIMHSVYPFFLSLFNRTEEYFICLPDFHCLANDGHVVWFYLLAIVKRAAISMDVQISL